jgi:hypothetical protein
MTKTEALAILAAIDQREIDGVNIEQGLQLAVNTYVDNLLSQNPNIKIPKLKWEFEKKSNNLITAFQHALKNKIKILNNKVVPKVIEEKEEDKTILSEVCKILKVTPQNLNHLLRNHKEIKVIEVSSRKRYLTKSEIEKLKKLGRK